MHSMSKFYHTCYERKQRGLSLIELMVAMSLSLLLMLGVYKVFDFQQRAFQLISSLNEREDNAQLAMKILSDGIRMADHWGGVSSEQVAVFKTNLSVSPGDCDDAWVFDVSKSVYGIEGQNSAAQLAGLPNQCLKSKNYLQNSDLLSLRFGNSQQLFRESEIDTKRYQKHYFLRSQAGKSALLFQGGQLAQAVLELPDEGFHYNMAFSSHLYFLRPCVKSSKACVEGDSSLTRLVLMGDRYIQEALVEGIEQMHFEYGVDDDKNLLVDRYVPANQVNDWGQVLSVKIYLLVRNSLKDTASDEKGKVYVMNSSGSVVNNTYEVPDHSRYYPRRLYEREVVLRNRLFN